MVERREHTREAASIETRVFLDGVRPVVIPCRVLDVSEGGMKIQLNFYYQLPRLVVILRAEHENMYECRTAWQSERTAGLDFLDLCTRAKHEGIIEQMKTARVIDKDSQSL